MKKNEKRTREHRQPLTQDELKQIQGGSWFIATHKGQALPTWQWE